MIPEICPECGHDRFVTSCYRAAGVTTGKTNCQRCGLLVATETPQPVRGSWLDDLGLGALREWFAPAPARPSAPRRSVPLRPLTPEESHARFAPPEPPSPTPAPAEAPPAPGDVYRTWGPSLATVETPLLPEEPEDLAPEETPQPPPSATIILGPLPLEGPPPSEGTEPIPAWEAEPPPLEVPPAPPPTAALPQWPAEPELAAEAPEPVPPEDERTEPSLGIAPAAPAGMDTEPVPVPRFEPPPPPSLLTPEPPAEPPAPAPAAAPEALPAPEASPAVPTSSPAAEASVSERTEPLPVGPPSEVRSQMESCDNEQLSVMLGRSSALGWSPAVYELVQQILRERHVPLPSTAPPAPEDQSAIVPGPLRPVAPLPPPVAPAPVVAPPPEPSRVPPPPTAAVPRLAPPAPARPAPRPAPAPLARPPAPAPAAAPRVLVRPGRPRRLPTIAPVELPVPSGDALCDPLMDVAQPQLYRSNAFRVAGLSVEATPREIARQAEKLRLLEKLGGGASAAPGGPLALDPAPAADGVREAIQRLGDPERRLIDELLWVWAMIPGATASDEALAAFNAGQSDSALERWSLGEIRAPEAAAARHNLAVVHHVRALDLELRAAERPLTKEEREEREACWAEALPRWRAVLSLEPFWTRVTDRVRALDDPRLTTGAVRRVRATLPLALLLVDARLARAAAERGEERETERHRRRMTDFALGPALVEEALKRAATPVWEQVQQLCRSTEPKADADPTHADKVTRDLLRQAAPLLRTLDQLLPEGHATRVGAHDEVALRALACQITFGNKTDDWSTSLTLLKTILPIASSSSAKGRIEDNLRIVERNLQFATCWFCKKQPSEDAASVSLEMYGNVVRVPVWNGVRVQWQKVTLAVPRCGDCKARQARASTAIALGVVGGLVTGGGLALVTGGHPVGLVFGLIFAITGITLGALRHSKALAGIQDESHKLEFPSVKEKRAEGWQLGSGPQG